MPATSFKRRRKLKTEKVAPKTAFLNIPQVNGFPGNMYHDWVWQRHRQRAGQGSPLCETYYCMHEFVCKWLHSVFIYMLSSVSSFFAIKVVRKSNNCRKTLPSKSRAFKFYSSKSTNAFLTHRESKQSLCRMAHFRIMYMISPYYNYCVIVVVHIPLPNRTIANDSLNYIYDCSQTTYSDMMEMMESISHKPDPRTEPWLPLHSFTSNKGPHQCRNEKHEDIRDLVIATHRLAVIKMDTNIFSNVSKNKRALCHSM